MPDVRLTAKEEKGDLPEVCMCCGARATEWVKRTFILQPPVVHGPSGFAEIYAFRLLLATAQAPRMELRTSFCPRHRNYWRLRFALKWGGLAGFLALLFFGFAVVVFTLAVLRRDAPVLFFFVLAPSLLFLIAAIISSVIVESRSIRAQLAPDGTEDIILHNVHARYVEALDQHRAQSRPVRRGTANSSLTEAVLAEEDVGLRPGRKVSAAEFGGGRGRATNSADEAAAYQSIADQLTNRTTPRTVEANLVRSGWGAETAQLLVARVLEEMPGFLRSRYTWQLYVSLGLFGVALMLVLSVSLLAARDTSMALLRLWVLALLWVLGQGYWSAVSIWKVWLAQRLEKARAEWLRASGIAVGVATAAERSAMPSATARPSPANGGSALARRAIEARDAQRLQRSGLLFGGAAALLLLLGVCIIVPIADRIMQSLDSRERTGQVGGTDDVFTKLPATAPLPAELREHPGVDLIALLDMKKDVVHGPWEVRNGTLYCTHGGFVPRVQFPYLPPEEYDFIVTFANMGPDTGTCVVMPKPRGGSFFWVCGGGGKGAEYGFWGKPFQKIEGLIKPGTVHTTKVEVRKNSVRGFADGKELMHLDTDFHDLTADDWRRIHDVRFPAIACDAPMACYYARIVDVTGQGKKAR